MENLRDKYISVFFKKLSQETKKNIYFDEFMWHAFSYDAVSNLKYGDAIKEFKKRDKNDVYIFFQESDKILEKKDLAYSELLRIWGKSDKELDCYVVDKNFEWTFVLTHETLDSEDDYYIGPFFTSINMINK